jgi:uncharacterized protein
MSTEMPENPQQPPADQPIPPPQAEPIPPQEPVQQAPPPPPSPAAPAAPAGPTAEEKTWAMVSHLACVVFLAPLIVWLIQKDKMPFVDDQGKEAFNFQLSVFIVDAALWVLIAIGSALGFLALIIVPIIYLAITALGVYALVQIIMAAIKANDGVAYRYPVNFRLIK